MYQSLDFTYLLIMCLLVTSHALTNTHAHTERYIFDSKLHEGGNVSVLLRQHGIEQSLEKHSELTVNEM